MAERIQIVRATEEGDYEQSAMLLTVNDPWAKLGRTYAYSYDKVHNPEDELIVAKKGERVVGCLLLEMHSTLKAFVRALCVSAEYRSHGIGADLLAFAEHRAFKETANVFLFVSSERGKKFYETNGYQEVGYLKDLNITGVGEWIMRKTIGPNDEVEYNELEILVLDGDAETLEEAIRNAGTAMCKKGLVRDVYANIPVAIPHTDAKYVNRDCLCFQRMKKPVVAIEIGGTEELPCQMVVNLGMTGAGSQVTMLSKMMEVLQDEAFMNICLTGHPDEVKEEVKKVLGNAML